MDDMPAGPSEPTGDFGCIRAKILDEDGCPDIAYIKCFLVPVGPTRDVATSC
jgi:hypothetical protein